MKNINSLNYGSVVSRLCSKSDVHGKAKSVKLFLLFLLLITFSLSSFSQTRACDPTLVCIDYKIKLFDPSQNTWTIIDSTHCCPLHDFSQPQTPPFCQLMSMNQCECISDIRINGCLEGILTVELYDTDSNYIRDLYVRNYNDPISDSCFTISDVGQYLLKFRHFVSNQTTIYGWYSFNVVSNTDFLDDITIVAPDEVCYGSDICFSISNVFFPITYWYFWNNTMLGHNSIGHGTVPDSQTVCFQPQTLGINELKILMTDNCQDTTWYTKQINVKAFTNFSYPNPVCVNQAFSINSITWCNGPISGASYVWNWGDGSANSNTQLPSHTYTSSGTYNITLTVSNTMGSQSMTKQIQVNALPIKPTVTGNFNNCKLTNTYTITNQQSGSTYNWSATYCNTIPPGSASSKTITWFNNTNFPTPPLYDSIRIISNNGCVDTSYFRVWECCGKIGAPSYNDTVLTNSISSRQFYINGNIQINNNVTLDLDTILMGPEAKFTVNSPYKLKIRVSNVKAGCNYMWDGIYPVSLGEIEIDTSTVSDAYNAIVSKDGAKYTLSGAIFNKNLIGILVSSYSGTHPGLIRNSVFSSVDDFGNASNLIYPYATRRGIAGIKLNGVNAITIGNNLSASYLNTFKHLDYGIWINGSNINVYNNYFGPLPKTSGFIPDNGYGIYAEKDRTTANTINIGSLSINHYYSNTFQNCAVGIRSVHPFNINVLRNTFNTNDYANFITDNFDRAISINSNTFTNNQVGVWCNNFAGTTQNILNNTMTNTTTGVYLSNNVATPIVEVEISGNRFSYLNGTSTYNLANGIALSNVQGYNDFYLGEKKSHISANTIDFTGVTITESTVRSGIRIENSPMCFIEMDTIRYSNNSIPNATTADKLNGIYVVLSTNTELCSNVLQYLGNGVRIQGYCDNSKFKLNDFRRCNNSSLNYSYGFKFESATIGVQGTPTQTWDNTFNTLNFPTNQNKRGWGSMASQQQWNFRGGTFNEDYWFTYPALQPTVANALPRTYIPVPPSCSFQGFDFMNGMAGENEISCETESEFLENNDENQYFKAYTMVNNEMSSGETNVVSNTSSTISSENISKLLAVNLLVSERLFDSADSLNQLIEPVNLIEKNMKTVNEIYLRTWARGIYNLSLNDYTILVDIAMQAPKTSGYGVIGAWVMVGRFENNQVSEKFSSNSFLFIDNTIVMYPNPANSQLSFDGVESVSFMDITDLLGHKVMKIENKHASNFLNVTINDLKKGIYLVNYFNEKGEKIGFEKLILN